MMAFKSMFPQVAASRRSLPPRRPALVRAMTLVEVLAVVVILGMLAATLAAGFSGAMGKGKREIARTGIGVIVGRLEMYLMEYAEPPSSDVGLSGLTTPVATASDAYYLAPDQLIDPWGRPYLLVAPGRDGLSYEILSLGADGRTGGSGEAADVTSASLRAK